MNQIWTAVLTTACTVLASLLVTYLFNKLSGLPKKLGDEKQARQQKMEALDAKDVELENKIDTLDTNLRTLIDSKFNELNTDLTSTITELSGNLSARLEDVEEATSHYPEYRAQSLRIQGELQQADINILDVCNTIKNDVVANRAMLDSRLKSLENREKNALRDKIYEHWRNFTSPTLNPRQTWTDMEQHAFNELVKDYESLGGNDYVHKVILPEMSRLAVIPYIDNLDAVKELFESRNTSSIGYK